MIFVADIVRNEDSFEICHTSFNIRNSENLAKSQCFWKSLQWRALFTYLFIYLLIYLFIYLFSFEIKEGWKVSCVKRFFS